MRAARPLWLISAFAVAILALRVAAQTPATGGPAAAGRRAPSKALTDYEGVYEYQGGTKLVIVGAEPLLFAVLDDAKYPLRPLGVDTFQNAGGDTIPFRRSADGAVSGFVERGVFFARLSPVVDPEIAAAVRARPRPTGPDGRAVPYEYRIPADLGDGLAVGELSQAGLDRAVATRLVDRVVDGTYKDVHGILVYRAGRLVIEEYFYEDDRDRVHQMRSASKSVVSTLVGIAIDRGVLAGDGELVLKRLPYESYANADPRKGQLTLRDLLTMRSGLACNDWDGNSPGNESRVYQSQDWVKFVLDLPMLEPPGTHGQYCSGNVAVAGRMVERATGTPLPSFAQQHCSRRSGLMPPTCDGTTRSAHRTRRRSRSCICGRETCSSWVSFSNSAVDGRAARLCRASGSSDRRRGGRPSETRTTDISGGTSGPMSRSLAATAAWTWSSPPATAGRKSTSSLRSISSSS